MAEVSYEVVTDERSEALSVTAALDRTVSRSAIRSSQLAGARTVGSFEVTFSVPRPLDGFTNIGKALMDFVTFAADQGSALISCFGRTVDGDDFEVVDQLVLAANAASPSQEVWKFLFTAPDIDLSIALLCWLEICFGARPALDMMLVARYQDSFMEFEALTIASTIDRLHPFLLPNASYRDPQDYATDVKTITESITDKKLLGWVKCNLRNDPTFRMRAEQLAQIVNEHVLAEWIGDASAWSKGLNDARLMAARGTTGAARERLRLTIQQSRYVLALVLMTDLGVSEARMKMTLDVRCWVRVLAAKVGRDPSVDTTKIG